MQSSKVLLVVCAAALFAIPLSGRGADKKASSATKPVFIAPTPSSPDAITKAQEALRQKMDELNGQTPAAAAQAPATPVPQAPAVATPQPAPVAVPAIKPADPEPANKALNALRQKMDEVNGQPLAAAPAPVAVPQPTPAAVEPAPVAAPQTPIAPPVANAKMAPVPAFEQGERESIIKAREALHQKMTELPSQPVSAEVAKPAPVKPVKVAKAKAETEPKADKAAQAEAKRKADEAAKEQAEAKRKAEKAAREQAKAKPVKAKAEKEVAQPVVVRKPAGEFPSLEGPPSPLASDKQQRLAELLQKYRADQLTPEQYHLERAKILAQP